MINGYFEIGTCFSVKDHFVAAKGKERLGAQELDLAL